MKREKILTLILAGGAGGRLDVLTAQRAKPALPFGGTLRLIDFALSNCLHSGLADVWVIEQYQLHTLNEHLANGRPWDLDRTYGGLQVLPPYAEHDKEDGKKKGGFAEGNADAIYRQRRLIREFAPDLIVVLSADHIYELDYRHVGTPESYWQAHMDLLDRQPELALDDPAWPILTYGAQRLPARLLTGAQVDDCLLSPGCTVAGRVTQSVLAPDVTVEPGAEVHGSILLHGVKIGAGARVCRALVDEGTTVAAGAVIGADVGDLTLVGRGAEIAAGKIVAAGEHVPPKPEPGGEHERK